MEINCQNTGIGEQVNKLKTTDSVKAHKETMLSAQPYKYNSLAKSSDSF